MHLDVRTYSNFYREDPLGAAVRRLLAARLTARWRTISGRTLLGLGYATPLLAPFRDEAEATIAFMPAGQGVVAWPRGAPATVALVDETNLPLSDASVDHVIAMHLLESCDRVPDVIAEAWRVLSPEGSLFIVAANRLGAWTSFETSPFAHGRSFNRGQLEALLKDTRFLPEYWGTALAMPPTRSGLVLRSPHVWERMGLRIWPAFAGVILVEARKRLRAPAGTAPATAAFDRRPALVRGARAARSAGNAVRSQPDN